MLTLILIVADFSDFAVVNSFFNDALILLICAVDLSRTSKVALSVKLAILASCYYDPNRGHC